MACVSMLLPQCYIWTILVKMVNGGQMRMVAMRNVDTIYLFKVLSEMIEGMQSGTLLIMKNQHLGRVFLNLFLKVDLRTNGTWVGCILHFPI